MTTDGTLITAHNNVAIMNIPLKYHHTVEYFHRDTFGLLPLLINTFLNDSAHVVLTHSHCLQGGGVRLSTIRVSAQHPCRPGSLAEQEMMCGNEKKKKYRSKSAGMRERLPLAGGCNT